MKSFLSFALIFTIFSTAHAQKDTTLTLKKVILNQLKTTHNKEDWFAPLNVALDGVSFEQANWKEKGADHSIAELTTHIIFWNEQELAKFLNQPEPKYSGDNKETFAKVDKDSWPATVKKADSILVRWENAIEASDDIKLASWYETIGHISTHNAYHTGQIVYIRKVQGSWNPEKGVK